MACKEMVIFRECKKKHTQKRGLVNRGEENITVDSFGKGQRFTKFNQSVCSAGIQEGDHRMEGTQKAVVGR